MGLRTCAGQNRLALDAFLAVFFILLDTVLTLAGTSWWPAHPGALAWTMLAVQGLADASLVFRRRAPMLVIAILGGFTLAISLLITPAGLITPENAGNVWAPYGTILAAYGPFYYRRDRRAAFAAVGTLTLIVAEVWAPSPSVITVGVLRTAVGPLLALYFTARHEVLQGLRERAERAEQERYLLAEQARAEERARLAGEMHDVVTHRVSLMVLQAGALSVTATDEAARQAAEELRAAGCQALDELRDLVGILRTESGSDQTPTVSGLPALIAESAAAGTPAELAEDGDPALASPVVGRTAYRIVREALTNARKHAPGASVLVRIGYTEQQVRVVVSNRPATQSADRELSATGSGLGLAGLRQRVELVHGTLRAGPAPDGGFRVEAVLPAYVPTPEPSDYAERVAEPPIPAVRPA
ncbi:MAG TPA: histidine kinase [Streptosporangiaceae bacterium]|nr:histidine kinase [Streptosporangiaceae bacterium]